MDIVPVGAQLISSPLRRAQETAAAFANKRGEVFGSTEILRGALACSAERSQGLAAGVHAPGLVRAVGRLWEWRKDILSGLKEATGPTVVFCHFLVINAVIAEIENKPEVLQFIPPMPHSTS